MKSKNLIYGLIGLVSSSAVSGLLIISSTQAQTPNSEHDSHHPSQQANPPQKEMMTHTDQNFIEMMIPHYQETVKMADIALTRAQRPEIKNLAIAIKKDQNRKIEQLRTWYKAWYGKEVPVMAMTHQEMMASHGKMCQQMKPDTMKMPMNCKMKCMNMDLETLKNAPDFDKEFIRQMIPHHQSAVKMSQMIAKKTTKLEIRNLAESIIKTQTAEIKQMEQWYQNWYNSKPL
ncbi:MULTISPECIES: DUF305 domain-containing protein [unclassified Anabaena]|uniref:DUF305 domain-containing protein n=1 Tax=unclassified Anabaena TaxID=2619674 RepID=UPI001446DDFF|nr:MULTISPECIES: DUF305 domain-containing protein [unclassified Anabaena]MTJ06638.1 DUF305 domain-containing protein [Anabaena sp. UHCC 0204]MTJ54409.1 DUF305 domain-containing protein [Anabaena sp. UHCC 0253]